MAKHQIIYTSCMRGIDGVNDGQQIFSYDAGFAELKNDEVKSLFTYQVPSLAPGVIMTEELALTMPAAFSFRNLKSGKVSVTLNTYLGRDYMGSAGRFGNYLSHSVVCDSYDMNLYPSEIYGSSVLRSAMEYSVVNNPKPPAHLPEAVLEKGYIVNPDHVTEFLAIGDNLDYYKKMVCAMLRFATEKKRIVICDSNANIIMWIAALHYALPLEIARKVDFTTYEFDPELSPAQICGVVCEGSRYQVGNYLTSGRHYVFDFINAQFNDVVVENQFVEFLDTAFSFSYDSLTEFHEFVRNHTTYRGADEVFYSAYDLYSFFTEGISEFSLEKFNEMIDFSEQYATDEMKKEIVCKLVEESKVINNLDNEYALIVIRFMLNSMNVLGPIQQGAVKQLIVDRLILSLSDVQITEADFLTLYDIIDGIARSIYLSIPAELMAHSNRNAILKVVSRNLVTWKIYFLVRIMGDYVKDTKVPIDELYADHPIGSLYFTITKVIYGMGRNNGFIVVEKILDNFKDSGTYLVNQALNIEGFLDDLGLQEMDNNHLWSYFTQLVLEMNDEEISAINVAFLEYDRFEGMFMLYQARMEKVNDLKSAQDIFKDTFEYWFAKNHKYEYLYAEKVLNVYHDAYTRRGEVLSSKERYSCALELLHLAMGMKIETSYVDSLMKDITEYIPLEKPNREFANIISEMQNYQYKIRSKKIQGKLLLFCIGTYFDKIRNSRDVKKCIDQIEVFADEAGADITKVGDRGVEDYFAWILEKPLECALVTEDYVMIEQLFVMSKRTGRQFMECCYKTVYKRCKVVKDYSDFAQFLKFIFSNGLPEDKKNIGKYLCKLSKQKLDELDEEMKHFFKNDKKAKLAWEEVRQVAGSTNPLLNNLTGLFKRK